VRWSIDPDTELRDVNDERVRQCLNVFREGMGLADGWDVEGVRETMRTATFAAYLHDGDEMVGYAHYDAIAVPGDPLDRIVLWERSVCLLKAYQGVQHGRTAVRMAFASVAPTRGIGWFGGRTQNPVVLSRYQRIARPALGLLPFDHGYDAEADDTRALARIVREGLVV
jgi:hypothetical protein